MTTYGAWRTFSGIRQSVGTVPDWLNGLGHGATPTFGDGQQGIARYRLGQSFAAYAANEYPWLSDGDRACALHHAAEGETRQQLDWDPGECAPLIGPNTIFDETVSSTSPTSGFGLAVGTRSSWQGPPLFLSAAHYDVEVYFSTGLITWAPVWVGLPPPYNQPYGNDQDVHLQVLTQIPGWLDAIDQGVDVQVQVLRVDGEASIICDAPQALGGDGVIISGHTRTPSDYVTPYSALGATEMSLIAGSSGSSSVVQYPDMQPGDVHAWDFASSRVISGTDPGLFDDYVPQFRLVVDFVWQVRMRMPGNPVVRWRQRDDGLGISFSRRARGGTSVQLGNRHRGYR